MNKVRWSPNAEDAYLATLEFVIQRYGTNAALILDDQIEQLMAHLSKFKNLCPPSLSQPNTRKCVIGKNASLLYQVDNQGIEILMFYDNRSDIYF
jgi:plasmid stabilization system protein ParE